MAIENDNFKVKRLDSVCSLRSRETMSSDDDEVRRHNSAVESDDDDEFDDADSGAGSDDFDLLELGETSAEFCQIGNQTCSIPLELYDLPGIEDILSIDVWNECLSEEERFELAKYLPDMDKENFVRTLKELFTGCNLHFGSPIKKLFQMLKGGLCEPRVSLYREGLSFFQKRQHYHLLRKHQNNMVSNLCQIRDAWFNCRGYSIEERLRVLNIMKSQKSLMHEKMEDLNVGSSDEESDDGMWSRKNKDTKAVQKISHFPFDGVGSGLEFDPRQQSPRDMEQQKYGKQNTKGILRLAGLKTLSEYRDRLRNNLIDKSGVLRIGKRHDLLRGDEVDTDNLMGLPVTTKGELLHGYNRNSNQSSDMKMFTAKSSSKRGSDQIGFRLRSSQMPFKDNLVDKPDYNELFYNNRTPGEDYGMDSTSKYDDWNPGSNKWKPGRDSPDLSYTAYRSSSTQVSDRFPSSDFRTKSLQEKIRGSFIPNGGKSTKALRDNQMFVRGEETESDSSEQMNGDDDDDDDNPLLQSKFAYFMGSADGSRKKSLKSHLDPKKTTFVRKDVKACALTQSKKKRGFKDQGHMHGVENHLSKGKQKGKIHNYGPLRNPTGKIMEESYPTGSDILSDGDDDRRQVWLGKNRRMQGELVERLGMPLSNAYVAERKKKGKTGLDHSIPSPKYLHDFVVGKDVSLEKQLLVDDSGVGQSKSKRKRQKYVAYKDDQSERSEAPLLGCNSAMKKRKVKDEAVDLGGGDKDANLLSNTVPQNDSTSLKRKSKKKAEVGMVISEIENSELPITDMGMADVELEAKPQKKQFTLITPTVHTGFSFSIIHLISAVRTAMISPLIDESLEVGKPREEENKAQEGSVNGIPSYDKVVGNCDPDANQLNMPSLTIQEIVNRVRSNPEVF
ncbi:putative nuclear factor related to kappa-B-binding protein [Lupinus albus]|uniref:Putative nuclear factor related to kappa-B-binding protein n=1 Tax=Lupinus albus TaxID=3870 RepID=A0A6A4PGJ0_LUPAL|nr:putative nuclear factor related to kappa-B-binding protein [Lupinus albus]